MIATSTLIPILAGGTLAVGVAAGVAGVRGARRAKRKKEETALADE